MSRHERPAPSMSSSKSVRNLAGLAGAACLLASPAFAAGDAKHGAEIFKGTCGVCHQAQPHPAVSDLAMRIGPNLWGVVGRKAGTTPHFHYSAAMMQSGIVWTPDKLRPYIHEPQKTLPNIRMSFQGLKNLKDVDDVVAYLQTFK
ncbi:MAG: c-type cytochrome [Caulobacteraceae bacterium]